MHVCMCMLMYQCARHILLQGAAADAVDMIRGGSVRRIQRELVQQGLDLDSDWQEAEQQLSTTGRGKGGRGGREDEAPASATPILQRPTHPMVSCPACTHFLREQMMSRERAFVEHAQQSHGKPFKSFACSALVRLVGIMRTGSHARSFTQFLESQMCMFTNFVPLAHQLAPPYAMTSNQSPQLVPRTTFHSTPPPTPQMLLCYLPCYDAEGVRRGCGCTTTQGHGQATFPAL